MRMKRIGFEACVKTYTTKAKKQGEVEEDRMNYNQPVDKNMF